MSRGYGGTMPVAFFPPKVITLLEEKGFKKSKNGRWYKKYEENEEFIAMPSCMEDAQGYKCAVWYIFAPEPKRQLHQEEARQMSTLFDEDFIEIREMMLELEQR